MRTILIAVAALAASTVVVIVEPDVSRVAPPDGPDMPSILDLTLQAKDLPTQAILDTI